MISKKRNIINGALVGLLITVPLTSILYLAYEFVELPFVPFDLFDWMTMVLPGSIVTFGIDLMIDLFRFFEINVANSAKNAEQLIAILQFILLCVLICAFFFGILRRRTGKSGVAPGIAAGIFIGLLFITISIAIGQSPVSPLLQILWLLMMFTLWGLALNKSYSYIASFENNNLVQQDYEFKSAPIKRRKFLWLIGGISIGITVLSTFVGRILAGNKHDLLEFELGGSEMHSTDTGNGMPFPNLNDPVMPAPGTRPEYTPIKNHYKVFIRTKPTVIDGSSWTLNINGMVNNPLRLTLDDIKNNYEKSSHYVTLSCISGKIGTSLISTTLWTGASLQQILADADVSKEARYLHIMSGDGYYETVDLQSIYDDERIILCYAWDGRDLPVGHGYPLRIWIPDRYGMKQPKWITDIEISDKYKKGYWVERGWDEKAIVKTTSVIDTVSINSIFNDGDQKLVSVGGIAFAGARGISKVEVRVDKGIWKKAKLRAPLSETTWVIWRYDWPYEKGEHIFEVRCAELDGTPQIETIQSNHPSGATGIHSYKITV